MRSTRTPWLVWAVGLVVYVVAIAQRTSFGVAGLSAAERFAAPATVLSLFAVLQITTYAALQLPMGMALDAWGPRRVLVIGGIVMAIGQLGMALAPTIPVALGARVLLGAGDAGVFIAVLRLVWTWFDQRRVPLLTQLTSMVGGLGQVISAVPFAFALTRFGWSAAFVALAALAALAAGTAAVGVRSGPAEPARLVRGFAGLGSTLSAPATWLGFFSHLLGGVSINAFVFMWGVPFLVDGQGLTITEAGALLTVNVITPIVLGPFVGEFTARHPLRRSWGVLAAAAAACLGWALVLVPATPRPMWVLGVAIALLAVGGTTSLIGIDLTTSFTPAGRRGTAQGVVNMGGFVGAIAFMFTVGVILDHLAPGGSPTLLQYRAALAVVYIPLAVGIVGVVVTRRRVRADAGITVPPLAEVVRRYSAR